MRARGTVGRVIILHQTDPGLISRSPKGLSSPQGVSSELRVKRKLPGEQQQLIMIIKYKCVIWKTLTLVRGSRVSKTRDLHHFCKNGKK